MAHGEFSHCHDDILPFIRCAEACELGVLGFAEHDWYLNEIDFELIRALEHQTPVKLRVGLEIDHRPGLDSPAVTGQYPFDYLIGSVHEIDGFLFDHPDYLAEYANWDNDRLYQAYFERMEDLIRCGHYDIVGHFDLIKVFGCRPKRDFIPVITDLLQLLKVKDLVLEVNTSGIHKPVNEKYPSDEILRICSMMDIPITLGSDAHLPNNVGRDLAEQARSLVDMGFKEIVSFDNRKPTFHSLL